MSKGKVFSKKYIISGILILALGAAVWLNMRYSDFEKTAEVSSDTEYINVSSTLGEAVSTSAGVEIIASSRAERDSKRSAFITQITDSLINCSADTKETLQKELTSVIKTADKEISAETIIKAKGFSDALVIISEESVTVMVPKEELLSSEILQLQDAVVSQTDVSLDKIKVIGVK